MTHSITVLFLLNLLGVDNYSLLYLSSMHFYLFGCYTDWFSNTLRKFKDNFEETVTYEHMYLKFQVFKVFSKKKQNTIKTIRATEKLNL